MATDPEAFGLPQGYGFFYTFFIAALSLACALIAFFSASKRYKCRPPSGSATETFCSAIWRTARGRKNETGEQNQHQHQHQHQQEKRRKIPPPVLSNPLAPRAASNPILRQSHDDNIQTSLSDSGLLPSSLLAVMPGPKKQNLYEEDTAIPEDLNAVSSPISSSESSVHHIDTPDEACLTPHVTSEALTHRSALRVPISAQAPSSTSFNRDYTERTPTHQPGVIDLYAVDSARYSAQQLLCGVTILALGVVLGILQPFLEAGPIQSCLSYVAAACAIAGLLCVLVPTVGNPTWLLQSQGRSAMLAARVLPVLFNTITFQIVYAAMYFFPLSACQMNVTVDLAIFGVRNSGGDDDDDPARGNNLIQVRWRYLS
jgi:hypothetical protein